MAFDKDAEGREAESMIMLVFKSGTAGAGGLPMPPSAYLAFGSGSSDERERPMLTTEETSFGALQAQAEMLKSLIDARVAEAKAQFAAAIK